MPNKTNGGDTIKDIPIFNINVANDLILQGFTMSGVTRDRRNEILPVFHFKNTYPLRNYLKVRYDIHIQE